MASDGDVRRRQHLKDNKNKDSSESSTRSGPSNSWNNMWPSWTNFPFPTTQSSGLNSPEKAKDDTSATESLPTWASTNEYCEAVRQWIWQYNAWNQMNCFQSTIPFYAMSCFAMQQQMAAAGVMPAPPFGAIPGFPPSPAQQSATPNQPEAGAVQGNTHPPQQGRGVNQAGRNASPQQREAREFKLPSLWKRVSAEFIDFVLLFLLKLGVTIMAVEYVGIVDIQKYDLEYLLNQNLDYNAAFAITSELVAMEVINRIFICIFETLCLRRGVAGFVGGTTPGKRLLGLCVVSCEDVTMMAGNHVRVTPAGDIGFWNALVRSVIKNFSLAFFFPVCFTVFFFQYNRAAYDIISNCIVVERLEEEWGRRR